MEYRIRVAVQFSSDCRETAGLVDIAKLGKNPPRIAASNPPATSDFTIISSGAIHPT